MILIFGGAYQGKIEWALTHIRPDNPTVFTCREDLPEIDLSAAIINHLHLYILALIRAGRDPVAEISAQIDSLADRVIICDDITGGVVPESAEQRAWREAVGRVMGLLSGKADRVVRVFCGIGTDLK